MKILKGQGEYKILTPKEFLLKQLLIIEKAGRVSHQSEKAEITLETATKFIKKLIRLGHESVLEHSSLTVLFNNVSRGFTHEIVRHRIASFTQESTRYVDYQEEISCIVPQFRDENQKIELEDGRKLSCYEMFSEIEKFYRALRKAGWHPQDARQILPIGIKSQIVVTANFREWRHIFTLRCDKSAHWEIRYVLCELLEELKSIIPAIFDDFELAGVDKYGIPYYKKVPI